MPRTNKRKRAKETDIRTSYKQLLTSLEQLASLHASIPDDADVQSTLTQLQTILLEIDTCFEAINNAPKPRQANADSRIDDDTLHATAADVANKPFFDEEKLDRLDREGVMLWNRSTAIKQSYLAIADEDDEKTEQRCLLVATARYAAARLVALGAINSNDICDTERVLSMYVRSADELCDAKALDLAHSACELATHEKELLLAAGTGSEPHRDDSTTSFGAYYHARAKLAFLQGKVGVADFLTKESLDSANLAAYNDNDRLLLGSLCYVVARSFITASSTVVQTSSGDSSASNDKLKTKKSRADAVAREASDDAAEQALQWLNRSLLFVSGDKMACGNADARDVQIKATKAKAQIHIDRRKAGDRAGLLQISETLDDILKHDNGVETYCARLKLDLLLNNGDTNIKRTIEACMANIDLTQDNLLAILHEASKMPAASFDIIVKGLLERADDGGLSWLHLPVAAACRALTAELSNLHFFESLLQSVIEQFASYTMPIEAAFLCQGVLWKLGDWAFVESDCDTAAAWYLLSTHQVFGAEDVSNRKKAVRKASLCYLRDGNIAEAQRHLLASSARSASDAYILYLCALREEAPLIKVTEILDSIVTAEDFEAEMLLWAVKQAGEFDREDVSIAIYTLLCDVIVQDRFEVPHSQLLSLCKSMLASATAQLENCADTLQVPDVDSVIRLLSAGLGLLEGKQSSLDSKCHLNAIWICRQAISIALLPSVRRDVEVGFDFCQFGLRAYSLLCSIANGFDDKRDTIIARFSLLAVQVAFLDSHHSRSTPTDVLSGADQIDLLLSKTRFHDDTVLTEIQAAAMAMRFNIFAHQGDWSSAQRLVERDRPLPFLQAALHTACASANSPSQLNVSILEAISIKSQTGDLGVLAKLVRAMLATCLDRLDTELAAAYVASAAALAARTGPAYPRHELEWLATTCWNQGVKAREQDSDARQFWCEKAIELASRVSGFADMHSAMQNYYRQMQQTLLA